MTRLEQLLGLLEQNPKDSFVCFALAKEYENTGEVEKALEYYSTLLQNNPDYVGAYFHLAQLYADSHQNEEAFRVYDLGIGIAKKLGDQHALSELSSARMNLEMEDLL